jgi:arabinose-5-phosphate isomerase
VGAGAGCGACVLRAVTGVGARILSAVTGAGARALPAGATAVVDAQGGVLGIFTDGDLRRALRSHEPAQWAALTAGNIMTPDPITVDGDALAFDAMKKMERNNKKAISVLPVANAEGTVIGILRLHDLVQAGLAEQPAKDN